MTPALRVEGLTKRFGGLVAVDAISFSVGAGEICGLIGPNGAGKTTVFNLVAGELKPDAGAVHVADRDVTGLENYEIARIGVARSFQLVHLFESMSVEENVLVAAEDHAHPRLWSAFTHLGGYAARREAAKLRAREALAFVGAEGLAGSSVESLSFGQQRLIATARALAARPSLLLLDEPAAGLSEAELEVLRGAVLRARSAGTSVLLVEHNVEFVMGLCDHVVAMNFGRKIADGSPGEVRRSDAVIEAYIGKA